MLIKAIAVHRKSIKTVCALLPSLLMILPQPGAAEWQIAPRLTASETYLDNVRQAPPGAEESDFVTELNPGLSVRTDSGRLTLDLDYQLQSLFYARNNEDNDLNHQLAADANAELLKDFFFLDAFASYNQVLLSPEGRGGTDNITISEDRTNVGTYTISPYAVRRLGNIVAEARYTFEKVDYSAASSSDSDSHNVFASIASDPSARRLSGTAGYRSVDISTGSGEAEGQPEGASISKLPARKAAPNLQWSLTYERDQTQFQDGSDTKLESILLDTSYRLGPRVAALAGAGYEDNDFERAEGTEAPSGSIWYVGVAWNPTPRTSLEARGGERFFGPAYDLILHHFTRTVTTEVQYHEDFSTVSDSILENQLSSAAGDAGSNTTTDSQLSSVPLPGISSEVYLRKRLTASISKATAKSVFVFDAFDEEREYQLTPGNEHVYGIGGSWNWQATARTTSSLRTEWQRQNLRTGDQEDLWQLGLQISRQISPDIDSYLDYRYGRRDSTDAEAEYRENAVAVGLQVRF